MNNWQPQLPTTKQCEESTDVACPDGFKAFATWYPQMGGYIGRCVIVFQPTHEADADYCFDAFVWHDGDFPFDDQDPRQIHHCCASQFIDFGQRVVDKQRACK